MVAVLRVLTCLTAQHDYRLVALAVAICAIAALASFKIYAHVAVSDGLRRSILLVLTGICSASGIWATHFIAMLAYDAGFPVAYEPFATAGSFFIAIAVTTLGFVVAASALPWLVAVGGAVIGAGIGVMHFIGMHALIVPGVLHWDSGLAAASIAIGVVLASAAMIAFQRAGRRRALPIAAGLFTLAVCGLHFTAMAAATILPDPLVVVPPSPVGNPLMVLAVSGATLVIMLSGIASTALMENHMRRQREDELRIQNQRFDLALGNMGEGLCMFDGEKRLVVCNGRYAKMYGLPPELLKPGTPHRLIIEHRVLSGILKGEASGDALKQVMTALRALPGDAVSSRIDELSDGRLIRVTRQPMAGGGWVATHLDVTEQQRSAAKIAHMAQHDALTDLPNRVLLHEHLDRAFDAARGGRRRLAVFMLDLDRFKDVNDTLGHPVGDLLLKAVAARLRSCLRESDMIARLGGDEFAIVQDVTEPVAESTALAEAIQEAFRAPFDLGGHQVSTGTSVGIAVAPAHGRDSDEILKSADLALYRAKTAGRGTHRFFEPELDRLMQHRRELEHDLRCALTKGEFELHYQPFANLKSGEIAGCEALLRWLHPERGLIPPAEFIPLAEETGLVVPLGEWVLRTACAEAARWPSGLKIAVNLSAAQFRSRELTPAVVSALAASGVAPSRLELEVTESLVMHDSELVFATLRRLQELGVRIALDDFGAGSSSLSVLRKFPFDKIKIDRGFVSELRHADEDARATARAVVRFAVSLGKTTTAEGVETGDQLEVLSAANCTEMQGYYFCRPKPASEIAPILFARASKTAVSAA